MSRLYVFGDSYTTPGCCVEPRESFWGLSAEYLKLDEIFNVSREANSFDSVCQNLIGAQNQYNYDWNNDWFIIGVPPLERVTLFDDHKNTQHRGYFYNPRTWEEHVTTVECHRGLVSEKFFGHDKFLIMHQDRSWLETQVLREIFLLTQWLDSKGANYLICNLSKPLMKDNWWGPSEFVLTQLLEHPRCILFDNTYFSVNYEINKPGDYDLYGWEGHHGPEGNKRYYEMSIEPKLDSIINT